MDLYHSFDADIAANGGAVPRRIMPQIDEADLAALFEFLRGHGVTVKRVTVQPEALCFRQHVDEARLPGMPAYVLAKPLLLSAEGCVMDGNHRAARHKLDGTAASAFQIMLPFEVAFDLLCEFGRTYTLGAIGDEERN